MDSATIQFLIDLNQRFYTTFGSSFAATRRRIQPGVRRVIASLPDSPTDTWLDLGCGSGALAVEWLSAKRKSAYLGMDFSSVLLEEAQKAIAEFDDHRRVAFIAGNLAEPGWVDHLVKSAQKTFAGVLCFAVLHHLPAQAIREQFLRQVATLLPGGGYFLHSVWQFHHSSKLMERRASWRQVGLDDTALEPGDTLLDWRAADPNQPGQTGLRYVHLFDLAELSNLAQTAGFQIIDTFESDGREGRLGLYQVWRKLPFEYTA